MTGGAIVASALAACWMLAGPLGEGTRPGASRVGPAAAPTAATPPPAPAVTTPEPAPETIPPGPTPDVPAGPKAEEGLIVSISRPAPAMPMPTPTPSPAPPPGPPEAKPADAAPARPAVVVKRWQTRSQEDLRKELVDVPEIGLNDAVLRDLFAAAAMNQGVMPIAPVAQTSRPVRPGSRAPLPELDSVAILIRKAQPALVPLDWRMGADCHLGREPAEALQILSRELRNILTSASSTGRGVPFADPAPDPERLRGLLLGSGTPRPRSWLTPEAIPALLQLLTAERASTRVVLIDVLRRIVGAEATRALAGRAAFDLDPEVRDRAVAALADRPAEHSRPTLMAALRYPWAPAADHAAEALAALKDRGALPDLVGLLDAPDPEGPVAERSGGSTRYVTREVVRVNHLRNCFLCHAPSRSPQADLVRGSVPVPGHPLPPPDAYYNGSAGRTTFVRAEITYLRQDFSVAQPVGDPGAWPGQQRYDYLVRRKVVPARGKEKAPETKADYPQRRAVLAALRELTGLDAGETAASWREALALREQGPPASE